jgi:glutathione synthase/RimK-type ligase-like ATP-grasp enzyme
MKMKIGGIRRQTEFSPNHVLNDFLIINRTAEELQILGAEITMYVEDVIPDVFIKEDYLFSMVQGPRGIEALSKKAKLKRVVINSPESVLNCYRYNMVKLLPENDIPFPKSTLINTDSFINGALDDYLGHKFWLKRGDAHAVHKEDVTLVYNKDEAINVIKEFNKRDIKQAIIQENLKGDTVKFYAIREMNFFHWFHLNGEYHTPFDEKKLIDLANKSAEVLGLYVYGGDAIISTKGEITIIDINDWPSFAPVREEACQLIAKLIYNKVEEYEK